MDNASIPTTDVHNHTAYRELISTLLGGGWGGGVITEKLRFHVVTMRNSLPRTTKKVLDGPWTWSLCVLHCLTLSAVGQWPVAESTPWGHKVSTHWDHTVSIPWGHKVSTHWDHTVSIPWGHKVSTHWDHTVSIPWGPKVSTHWDHTVSIPWGHKVSTHWDHTVSIPWGPKVSTHWDHTVSIPWGHMVFTPWGHTVHSQGKLPHYPKCAPL